MECNTEFLQFSSLGTSIYRLQVQMSVWLEKPRRCPEGRHKASGWTIVQSAFQNFAEILSRLEPLPDGRTFAAHNFHIKASCIQTIGMIVRTVDLMHVISIYVALTSEP